MVIISYAISVIQNDNGKCGDNIKRYFTFHSPPICHIRNKRFKLNYLHLPNRLKIIKLKIMKGKLLSELEEVNSTLKDSLLSLEDSKEFLKSYLKEIKELNEMRKKIKSLNVQSNVKKVFTAEEEDVQKEQAKKKEIINY